MNIRCNSPVVLLPLLQLQTPFVHGKPSVRHLLGVPSKRTDESGAPLVELAHKISCVTLATGSPHCPAAHVPH